MSLFVLLILILAAVYSGTMFCFLIGTYRVFTSRSAAHPVRSSDIVPMVSVIIAARDEAGTIERCLRSILACDWPEDWVEIVVVDDDSSDATADIVLSVAKDDARVHLVRLGAVREVSTARKKAAVSEGVRRTRGDIILQTDADCLVRPGWIQAMMATFDTHTGFVAGGVLFDSNQGFLEDMIRLEYAGLMGIAAGAIGLGVPILSSGANIAWRRDVFEEIGGHADLERFSSGDDDLFMQRIADRTRWQVRFCASRESIVSTAAPATVRAFLEQRKRWASKGAHYERLWLVGLNVCYWLFFLFLGMGAVAAIWLPGLRLPVLIAFLFKIVSEGLLLMRAVRFFEVPLVMWRFPLAQPFQFLYILWVGLAGMRGNMVWKSRKVAR